MRNRLVALSAVLAFALIVTGVAVLAGSRGGGGKLEKLSFAATAGEDRASTAMGAPESALYPNFGPVEYRVKGDLPDLVDKAPAYRLAATTTKQDVAELAATLGVNGEVTETDEGWLVRSGNRQLHVQRSPGLPWFLSPSCPDSPNGSVSSDEVVNSSGCAYGAPSSIPPSQEVVASRVAGGGSAPAAPPTSALSAPCRGGTVECQPAPAQEAPTTTVVGRGSKAQSECPPNAECVYPDHFPPPPPPPRDPDLPSRPEAERIARELAAKLGVEVERVEMYDGFTSWRVAIESRIGGLPTLGWGSSVGLGPNGRLMDASGFLAEPERIGDYPLVGTAKALERLRAGKGFGPQFYGDPRPLGGAVADAEPFAAPVAPAPVEPQVITITGVRLALQQVGPALVPVYQFEMEGPGPGLTPPVPAVTDEWIAANIQDEPGVPAGKPRPIPMPAPALMPPPPPPPTSAPPPARSGAAPVTAPSQVEGAPAPGR